MTLLVSELDQSGNFNFYVFSFEFNIDPSYKLPTDKAVLN